MLPDQTAPSPGQEATLEGVIERITFHAEDTGYTVARVKPNDSFVLATVVGSMGNPTVGESVRLTGRWSSHKEFGRQFTVERFETIRPATAKAIEKYLGSGLVKGLGPVMAKRMVAAFGAETLDIIETNPKRLLEVEGIGPKRLRRLTGAWDEQRSVRAVMLFLQGHGVSANFAVRIFKAYGDDAIRKVEENPYRLAQDIWGIGFLSADRIASNMGVLPESESRLRAGVVHVLTEATGKGHVYLPETALAAAAAEALGVDQALVAPAIEKLVRSGEVIAEPGPLQGSPRCIFPVVLHRLEVALAAHVRGLVQRADAKLTHFDDGAPSVAALAARMRLELSEEQMRAVGHALAAGLTVLTGGPGTGKTTVTNLICAAFEQRGCHILLASPTGRAAKRLSEVTGRPAQTVHRLLKFDPKSRAFQMGPDSPLPCDVLIADEASMLDTDLAYHLLAAVPNGAQVVLVGDADQLPSVGAGNVLADLIASRAVPVCRLTQVFRQAAKSLIVTNAHRINRGDFPVLISPKDRRENDCLYVEAEGSEAAGKMVVTVASKSMARLGFGRQSVQVLAPMHRGEAGVGRLNEQLQDSLNPLVAGARELVRGAKRLREGDRVLQVTNNYDKQVFNGDIGEVSRIDFDEQVLCVRFAEIEVTYEFSEVDELQLAYAMSVHKSQGSEYPVVVLVLTSGHYMMLQRNLLYTALTRARKLCVIVGEKRAIARAVKNDTATQRYTRLAERLVKG